MRWVAGKKLLSWDLVGMWHEHFLIGTYKHFWFFCRREENSFERDTIASEPPAKRVCTISPAPRHSPALTVPLMNPGGQFHPTPPPLQHYTLEDIATSHLYREPNKMLEHREVRERHHNLSKWSQQHDNALIWRESWVASYSVKSPVISWLPFSVKMMLCSWT